jgi:hypothetical protein
MNDIALEIIHQYIAELHVPTVTLNNEARFRKDSYSLWAAYEILRLVAQNPDRRPVEVIEEFCYAMDDLSCQTYSTSWIFSCAYDIATDILCRFL